MWRFRSGCDRAERSLERFGFVERENLGIAATLDALDEAREYAAGATLDDAFGAAAAERRDGRGPADRARQLAPQQLANGGWIRVIRGVHRTEIPDTRRTDFHRGQTFAQPRTRRFHEAAVGRHTDRQFDGALGAARFRSFDGPRHRDLLAG